MSVDNQDAASLKLPCGVSDTPKFPEDEIIDSVHGGTHEYVLFALYQLPDDYILTKRELAKVLGCSSRTVDRMVNCHDIPPGTRMLGRKIGKVWFAGKVKAWLSERAERLESEAKKEAKRLRILPY